MVSGCVQTHSRCLATPWILQIIFCGKCPSARSWPGLRLPTPRSDRWRRVRRPAGQRRTWNTASPSEETRRVDLSEEEEEEEEQEEGFIFVVFIDIKQKHGVYFWNPRTGLQLLHSLESTTGFHLLLHSLSCWAYCLSSRARSWKHATMSLQAWKASSVRFTVRW